MIHVQTCFCICKTRCLFIFTKMTCILILKKNQFFTSVLVNLLKNFEFLQYIKCTVSL